MRRHWILKIIAFCNSIRGALSTFPASRSVVDLTVILHNIITMPSPAQYIHHFASLLVVNAFNIATRSSNALTHRSTSAMAFSCGT